MDAGAGSILASAMLAGRVGSPVLFPCGDSRRDELPAVLKAAGIRSRRCSAIGPWSRATTSPGRRRSGRTSSLVASPKVAALAARVHPARRAARARRDRADHRRGRARGRMGARGCRQSSHGVGGRRPHQDRSPDRADATLDERSSPPCLPPRGGGASAGLDDASGRTLPPRVSEGARAGGFPDHGAARRSSPSR